MNRAYKRLDHTSMSHHFLLIISVLSRIQIERDYEPIYIVTIGIALDICCICKIHFLTTAFISPLQALLSLWNTFPSIPSLSFNKFYSPAGHRHAELVFHSEGVQTTILGLTELIYFVIIFPLVL